MLPRIAWIAACLFLTLAVVTRADEAAPKAAWTPEWSMNATIIEACSCPMFCQCYFNEEPAGHAGHGHEGHAMGGGAEHYCKFNNAYRINKGSWGSIRLDGAKFWMAGDLGGDFSKGELDWAVLTFDPSVPPVEREPIKYILARLFGAKWKSFTFAPDAPVTWEATRDAAVATLDGGQAARVELKRFPGMTDEPITIHNLRYWGAPRNNGFLLMPAEVETYKLGDKAFEFKHTNGFMITFDINSKDAPPAH